MNFRKAFLGLVVVLSSALSIAQNTGTGTPPFGSFTGGTPYDVINNQNLNVHFALPLEPLTLRGRSFSFSAINDSQIWRPVNSAWTPVTNAAGAPSWGWVIANPNGSLSRQHVNNGTCQVTLAGGVTLTMTRYTDSNFVFLDSEGTQHAFSSVSQSLNCINNQVVISGNPIGYATDASGYLLNAATGPFAGPDNNLQGTVISPSGVQYQNVIVGAPTIPYPQGLIVDPNGNYISVEAPTTGNGTTLTPWVDTTGIAQFVIQLPGGSYKFDDLDGNVRANAVFQALPVATNFGCPGIAEYAGTANVMSSISFSTGQTFSFTYEATPGNPSTYTGRLKTITISTGGVYEYDYQGPNDGINCADGTTLHLARTINDGTASRAWTFSRNSNVTTVAAPKLSYNSAANNTTHAFDGNGRETSVKIYQGSSASGTLLRTINKTWAVNGTPASVVTILEDGHTQAETDSTYDANGILQAISNFDYGSAIHGPLVRTTTYTYVADPNYIGGANPRNLIGLVSDVKVQNSTGAVTQRAHFNYDETGAVTSCPTGIDQHMDFFYTCALQFRGDLTSVLNYKDPVTPAAPVVTNFTYDFFGNALTQSVAGIQQLQNVFSGTYTFPISVTSGPPSGPQLTTTYASTPSQTQVASVKDANNQLTQFSYDSVGRATLVVRPDNARLSTIYDDINHTVTTITPIDATHSAQTVQASDALGNLSTTTMQDSGGSNTFGIIKNQYDELGRLSQVSNPYTGSAPSFFTTTQFDALGRPTLTRLPDGQLTTYAYSLQTTITTDPTGKQIKQKMDALGRVVEIDEPNIASPGPSNNATASVTINGALQLAQGTADTSVLGKAGGPLTSFVSADGSSHIFYFDTNQHINHLSWASSGGWQLEDISYLGGGTTAASSSSLSSVSSSDGTMHVFFEGTNQHIYQLQFSSSNWQAQDLTALTGNILAASGTSLASDPGADGEPVHLYYLGTNQHIYDLFIGTVTFTWQNQDLTVATGNTLAASNTKLSVTVLADGTTHLFYLGTNQHVYQLSRSNGGNFGAAYSATSGFSDAMGWNQIYYYPSLRLADVNGDGKPDLCGRGLAGVYCALNNGNGTFAPAQLWETFFTDANGYNQAPYGNTMMLADINGDGKADLCFRQVSGIVCELSIGSGFGAPFSASSDFSDAMGWNQIYYYPSLRLADVNGDGKPDLCGRGLAGVYCALNNGNGTFAPEQLWETFFTDANGYNQAPYGNTMMLADINGDGKADLCFRQVSGIVCELSTGSGFGSPFWATSDFSDAMGWNQIYYYPSLRLADVNGDGKPDLCGRGLAGVYCALNQGNGTFGPARSWETFFTDANGYNQAPYGNTMMLTDINGDGKADLCFRQVSGIVCELSAGNAAWQNQDLSALTGNILAASGTAISLDPGAPAGSFGAPAGGMHAYYLGANQHIYFLTWNASTSSWQNTDLTANTTNGNTTNHQPAAGTPLTGLVSNDGYVRLYFLDASQHIHETFCCNTSSWVDNDMMTTLGIAAAGTGTAMTSTGTSAGNKVHVYYQNGTQHIEHMYLSNTGWFNQDLTTTAATDVLDSGFVSLDVGGFTVTACFGPSASPGCSGQQQNVASPNVATSLAQALNATNSPVTATASGSTINVTWKVAGPTNALVYPLTTNHDNPGLFSNASFSSTGLNFSGGASSWFNSPFVTTYAYNAIGQLTSASKGNQTSTYVYDALGRRTSASTPEMAGGSATMQYNDLGLLTQSTDPRGVIGTYGYDTLNRITSVSYNVGTTGAPATPSLGYTYGNSATSFNNGRLLTMTDGLGSETYTYDNMGRRVRCDKVINGVTYTTLYQYNLSGEMTQIQYPSGRQVKPAYDSIGRPIGVSDTMNSINTTYASGINYNVAQQITQFTYGNGVVANMGYSSDGRQQLTSLQYTKGAQTLFGLNYTYLQNGGNNGQITGIVDLVDNGRSATYRYDPLARLNQAFTAGSTAFPNWDLAFSYDQYGNRTDETPQSDTSPSATVPSNHLLFTSNPQTNRTTSGGYAYDGNGNMTNDGVNSLVYNGANEIISSNLGAANYQYDGYGLRARKCGATCTASSTVYLYMGGNVIAEYDNGAAPTTPSREYIYLGNRLAKIEGGAAQYYHVDHLSVRALSDAGGTKIADRGHFPFGEQWYASGTATKFQFTNYERDLSDTGNDYASARYYINRQGRFSSPDPLNSSPNGYAYVMNDPINHTDSTGMVCDDDCQFNRFAAMFGGGDQCTVNGINAPCGLAKNLVDSDNAAICPNNNCGFQWDPTKGFQPTVKTGDDGQLWLWHPGTGFLVVSLLVTGDDGNYHYVEGYEGTGFWYPESAVHWGFGHIFDYTGTPMINGTRTPEEQKQYLNSFLPICDQIYNQYVDAGKEQAWKNVAINAGWAGAACTALKKNCLPAAAGAAYASDLNMALTGWNMSDIHRSYASQLAAAGCYTWNGKGWNVNF